MTLQSLEELDIGLCGCIKTELQEHTSPSSSHYHTGREEVFPIPCHLPLGEFTSGCQARSHQAMRSDSRIELFGFQTSFTVSSSSSPRSVLFTQSQKDYKLSKHFRPDSLKHYQRMRTRSYLTIAMIDHAHQEDF